MIKTVNQHIYKARLVAKKYSQIQGINYDETLSPAAWYNSIHTILAIANELYFNIHQMDVKTAFLNGNIDADIYIWNNQRVSSIQNIPKKFVNYIQKSIYTVWNSQPDVGTKQLIIFCKS